MALLLNLARASRIEAVLAQAVMGTGRTVLISKGGGVLRQQRFPFRFVSGIIPGDTGRRIGMGRYADAAHGGGEGMHMGVAECVQCGCADVAEC